MEDDIDDSIALAPTPQAARLVRRWLAQLAPAVTPAALAQAQLVVSELVTNCVRHAGLRDGDLIRVTRRLLPGRLRIEVTDNGPGFTPRPAVSMPAVSQVTGRGLALVDHLADRWGVLRDGVHRVWCEFDMRRDRGGGIGGPTTG